jgi:small subunit ribosomal protein S6
MYNIISIFMRILALHARCRAKVQREVKKMVDVINKYETIFVIDASLEEDKITALVEKFKSLISEAGEIESVDEWGKRKLAYPINDQTEGYYVLVNFTAESKVPNALSSLLNITNGIMRHIIVAK